MAGSERRRTGNFDPPLPFGLGAEVGAEVGMRKPLSRRHFLYLPYLPYLLEGLVRNSEEEGKEGGPGRS